MRVYAVLVCMIGLTYGHRAAAETCFHRLESGAEAQVAGELQRAEQTFRDALAVESCREPPQGDLLRFSLGRVLLTRSNGASTLACEAQEQLAAASSATDPNVARGIAQALGEASALCREYRLAEDWGERAQPSGHAATTEREPPAPAPPAASEPLAPKAARPEVTAKPSATASRPLGGDSAARRLRMGPRLEGGISGLAFGRLESGELTAGATVGVGLALEYRALETAGIFVEPGVALTSINVVAEHPAGLASQSAVWRRIVAEALVGAMWLPGGGGFSLRFGIRGGLVVDAAEKSALLSDDAEPIELASAAFDGVVGLGYGRRIAEVDLRVTVDASLGVLQLNAADDPAGWYGYRTALSVAALF